ncbi:MAG: helix-turn-helix domain-containing protein [Fibromonadaceae bacterium]|jgi:transcriptional regulator with XRE-family HTH domain|nr:helix-turn-helix domain-containing protein [Fibromonadaceae bacterium]
MEHKIGLKFFRKRLGLSQDGMAEKLNCVKTTYQSWENGRREPSVDIIRKLFVLGATVEELFGVKVEAKECLPSRSEFEKQVELALVKIIKQCSKQCTQL